MTTTDRDLDAEAAPDKQHDCDQCHHRYRPLRRDAVRNRERLIAAAHEVFADRGFGATMDDIAHHAGLGVGTAYRHFANKYELANAIFDSAVAAFVDSADDASATHNPWNALTELIELALDEQAHDHAFRDIMLGTNRESAEHRDAIVGKLGTALERAKAAGVVRPDAELSDTVMAIVMLCHVTETAGAAAPQLWRRYLPALLDGLRPGGPPMPVPALTTQQLDHAYVPAYRHERREPDLS